MRWFLILAFLVVSVYESYYRDRQKERFRMSLNYLSFTNGIPAYFTYFYTYNEQNIL